MHTPHFIVVKAKTGARACEIVEKHFVEWFEKGEGSEDNWYSVCGAVSETDEVFSLGQGRYDPTAVAVTTVKQVNAGLKGGAKSLPKDKKGKKATFNALEHEWNSGSYSEVGVTRIAAKDEKGKLWIVFVDMHS
jgi:hypothetical protein